MKKSKLDLQEARIIEYLEKNKTIDSTTAQGVCGSPNYKQSANLLLRLEREKLLRRIGRGVYELGVKRAGTQKEMKFRVAPVTTNKHDNFNFVIESNWKPSKCFVVEPIIQSFISAVKNLKRTQSVQILVSEIKKHCNWGDSANYVNNMRFRCKKELTDSYLGQLKFFAEKDSNGNVYAIRVMNYYGV